jgi:serine protease Do
VEIALPATLESSLPLIGVTGQSLTAQLARRYLYAPSSGAGVRVLAVLAGSPAAEAGLLKNDIIVEMAGEAVTNSADLLRIIPPLVAQVVEIVYFRAGARGQTSAELRLVGASPDLLETGMTLQAVSGGLRVATVTENGPAATASPALAVGDLIIRVEEQSVTTVAQFNRFLDGRKDGDTLLIDFHRSGVPRQTVLTLMEAE